MKSRVPHVTWNIATNNYAMHAGAKYAGSKPSEWGTMCNNQSEKTFLQFHGGFECSLMLDHIILEFLCHVKAA